MHSSGPLRRCVICTGLSFFKRNKLVAVNDSAKSAPHPTRNGSVEFTCLLGIEQLVVIADHHLDSTMFSRSEENRLTKEAEERDLQFAWCLGKSLFMLPRGLHSTVEQATSTQSVTVPGHPLVHKVGPTWMVQSSSVVPPIGLGKSLKWGKNYSADEAALVEEQRAPKITPSSSNPGADADASPHAGDKPSQSQQLGTVVQHYARFLTDLKPHVVESSNILYAALFTLESHQHAATLLSNSVFSWSAHARASRVLQVGSDKAINILHNTWSKWFGTGD